MKNKFELNRNYEDDYYLLKREWLVVNMKDGSGWTLFNPNTKEIWDIRFNQMYFEDDNLWSVEMKGGSGWTIFNAETKEMFSERFETITFTGSHPYETLKKYKNTLVANLKESGETVTFNPKTHEITKKDFNPKNMFKSEPVLACCYYKNISQKATSPKKVKEEFKKAIKQENKSKNARDKGL